MFKHYYVKNFYSLNSYLEFTDLIPIFINERTVQYKMFQDFSLLFDNTKFKLTDDHKGVKTYIIYDDERKNDGYLLDIRADKTIIIKAGNNLGVRYAINLLNDLVEITSKGYKIKIALIVDEASFPIRGIIEGYYGTPWNLEERLDMAGFMTKMRLNTYIYAPKSDIYHRQNWYELYPEKEFNDLKTIKNNLEAYDIDFYYCISPGYAQGEDDGFNYVGDADFERLFTKLKQLIEIGINKFGLLLDDIDYKLIGINKDVFKRPGFAHAYICNRVNKFLKANVQNPKLIMCPTEYHQIGVSEYRNDLKNKLDEDIAVFWTGDNVCAEVISENDARKTQSAFARELFIWDNFPVSDFTYGVREFIAPIINRTVNLSKYANGYIINPSTHYYISKVAMTTMAHYAWNSEKYDPEKSFEIALKGQSLEFYEKGLDFIKYNYPSVLSYGNLKLEKEIAERKDRDEISNYFSKVSKSAKALLKLDLPIIEELSPWLERVVLEERIVEKILNNKLAKEELLEFLNNIKFSGSELLDYLILEYKLLTEDEYKAKIIDRRGSPWYRVFENKRWQ
ncbi:MAG: beta-N-acetylglucosaminidase domain-containing protein [Bacilli bacterium]|nr:beta-N-acetylglucosaminidase domain-containing protein [Bacilli bacterium]